MTHQQDQPSPKRGLETVAAADEILLQAYLDGELTAAEELRLDARLTAEPALRERLDALRSLQSSLQRAFEAPLLEAPPARLAALFAAEAAPPRPASALNRWLHDFGAWWRERRAARLQGIALGGLAAAGLALVVLSDPSGDAGAEGLALGALPQSAALAAALETDATGAARQSGEKAIVQLGTFIDAQSRPCREFELAGAASEPLEIGVACRDRSGLWTVEFAATAEPLTASDGAIRPAAGPAMDAMSALLDSLGAGPLLGPDEEQRLIENGWR